MNSDLLKRARSSLNSGKGRPNGAFLRRAVSDSYYALFHALAAACADQLVGVNQRKSPPWCRLYRSLDHSKLKADFETILRHEIGLLPLIARIFITLQQERHGADYDPIWSKKRIDVSALIDKAEAALLALEQLADDDLLQLSSTLVARTRRDR